MQQGSNNKRQDPRYTFSYPIQIIIGTQITLQGQLRDLSLKSAFIKIKESIFMQPNDELNFVIRRSVENIEDCVHGQARISRIAVGEGIAIYFTKMDDDSTDRLKQMVESNR
jgi:hypothetical protein